MDVSSAQVKFVGLSVSASPGPARPAACPPVQPDHKGIIKAKITKSQNHLCKEFVVGLSRNFSLVELLLAWFVLVQIGNCVHPSAAVVAVIAVADN